jgi:FkbM family methyltransferase
LKKKGMSLPRGIKALSHLNRIREIWGAIVLTKSWWKLTRAYLKLGRIDYPWILETRYGQNIPLNNFHDCVTVWVIFCRHEYVVPSDAKVIIDLGANFGAFTLLAAHQAKQSRIISLEPFPASRNQLCENVASNGLVERVTCMPLAIAKASGERRMSLEAGPDQSRGLLPEEAEVPEKAVNVKTISLQELLLYVRENFGTDRIDLVKMDIEGGEHEWLPEIPSSILQNIRAWQMEYHPNGSKQSLFRSLEMAGFKCVKDYIIGSNCGVAHFERTNLITLL